MFLQTLVEWHCPEPSTMILAKGSGNLKRLLLERLLAQRTKTVIYVDILTVADKCYDINHVLNPQTNETQAV